MNEPRVQVIVDGVDITENPERRMLGSVDPLIEMRGILKALRIITGCPDGDSILTHTATIVRRYKLYCDRNGGSPVPPMKPGLDEC